MKKQHKTYILLVLVVVIWAMIGVQIFNYANPKEEEISTVVYTDWQKIEKSKKEKYVVSVHQRDPFLGKLLVKPKPKKKRIVQPKIVFPSIVYNGIVEGGKNIAFIVTIDGEQEILKRNKSFKQVQLLSGSHKQIVVKYKGKRKSIPIKQ